MFCKVGFIGLGTMGMPMAKNILKKDGCLLTSDLIAEKKAEIQAMGADIATDNNQVAKDCDLIFVSLLMPKIVEMVVGDLIENGHEGQYIIDTSTNGYALSVQLSEKAAKKGIVYMDVPISGGAGRAADGTLSIIAGCTRDEADKAGLTAYFETIGNKVHYAGKRGGGVGLKILNNMLSKAILFADSEAVMMAEHMGIDFDTFYDVVSTSSSQNEIFRIKREHMKEHQYTSTAKSYFPVTGTLKDLNLAKQLGEDLGVSSFNCNNVIQWYRIAAQRGYAEADSSSIAELIRDLNPLPEKNA